MHKKINTLKNKKILICVTGSIAAFKACEVIRLLMKQEARVQVMMSTSAEKFIGKATFAALTNNEVNLNGEAGASVPTTGGLKGSRIKFTAVAANLYAVEGELIGSGSIATPFDSQ